MTDRSVPAHSMLSLPQFNVKFGTSGARGLVTDLTPAYCWTFTRALLEVLGPRTRQLIIGHDLRPSSPAIAAACIAAANSVGVNCIFAGAVPTPALALAGLERSLPAIMVTGSHIPADRNGIKAYRPDGEITKADEEAMLQVQVPLAADQIGAQLLQPSPEIAGRYAARYISIFGDDYLAGLRVGIYEHSTVIRGMLHDVLRALGAQTLSLGRSDEFLPVDTEAIRPEDHELAKAWAASHGFDSIVSADGDADRPLLADEAGQWLRGDVLGILSARALKAATVVTPVSSNTALEKCGSFARIIRTRIGSPYVLAGMVAEDAIPPVVGYEANGGFLLGSNVAINGKVLKALPTRDALLPIILVLGLAKQQGRKLSALLGDLPLRFTHSDRLQHFATETSRELIARLEADADLLRNLLAPESGMVSGIDRIDGLRVTFASGDIVHLRPSGNAPELRCYAEAHSPGRAESLCRDCLDRIRHRTPRV
jgi:phosphomannomutase